MKLEPYLSPWRKPKCKWTTGLNIRADSFKMLGEKAVSTHCLTGTGKNFLNRTPTAQKIRPTTDKADLILKKRLHTQRRELLMGGGGVASRMGENIFQLYI